MEVVDHSLHCEENVGVLDSVVSEVVEQVVDKAGVVDFSEEVVDHCDEVVGVTDC